MVGTTIRNCKDKKRGGRRKNQISLSESWLLGVLSGIQERSSRDTNHTLSWAVSSQLTQKLSCICFSFTLSGSLCCSLSAFLHISWNVWLYSYGCLPSKYNCFVTSWCHVIKKSIIYSDKHNNNAPLWGWSCIWTKQEIGISAKPLLTRMWQYSKGTSGATSEEFEITSSRPTCRRPGEDKSMFKAKSRFTNINQKGI